MMNNIIRRIFTVAILVLYCYNNECFCAKLNNNTEVNKHNNTNKQIIRILSLDGGGTRGYIQAKFLELLCKEFNIKNLAEYFDLIVGTSIGGINTVALAYGMTPQDLIKFFRKQAPWIFTIRSKKDIFSNNASIPSNKPNKLQILYMISTGNPFYKSVSEKSNYGDARLRKELEKVFGNKLLNQLKTKVLLTSYDFKQGKQIVFNNTDIKNIPNTLNNTKIVDAVMATTSFPIYFPSINIPENYGTNNTDNMELEAADGGLFQCNPSILAFIAAKNIYQSADKYCILSIGTGIRHNQINFNQQGIIYNLLPVKYTKIWNVLIQSAKYTNDLLLQTLNNDPNSNVHYYRFDVTLDNNKDCSLDNSTKDFFDYLDTVVEEQYNKDKDNIKKFINNLKYINTSF